MTTILLCTDGSEVSVHALHAALPILAPADRTVLATVLEPPDVTLVSGVSGMGAGVMSGDDLDRMIAAEEESARSLLSSTATDLGVAGLETQLLTGDPANALVQLATELPASVIVMGSRGRGGLKRAILGSVSDYVVRHAPCPVLIVTAG